MFTPHHLSHVRCPMSGVMCQQPKPVWISCLYSTSVQSRMKSMDTICSSHKSLYRDFLSTRPTRLGEPPPVSLLLWSRGGLVIGYHCTDTENTCFSSSSYNVGLVITSVEGQVLWCAVLWLPELELELEPRRFVKDLTQKYSFNIVIFCPKKS